MLVSFLEGMCPPVPEMSFAEPDSLQTFNGSVISYRCPLGYVFDNLEDTARLVCDGETWQGQHYTCIGMLFSKVIAAIVTVRDYFLQ